MPTTLESIIKDPTVKGVIKALAEVFPERLDTASLATKLGMDEDLVRVAVGLLNHYTLVSGEYQRRDHPDGRYDLVQAYRLQPVDVPLLKRLTQEEPDK